ncbi:unnamed protein product [Brachionus calyciflorus]|uniref:Translocon-associated protein subunit alpha n=1 Tax=Brachionus calyciflorus TaxID=104777 RepID=A0A813RAS7_9BILA|nr:unnamed protein product [Brachionus calyciflorus]
MKFFNLTLLLIATFSFSLLFAPIVVRAEEDAVEETEEDAVVNEDSETTESTTTETEEETTEELSSPHVKTNVLFVQPSETNDLPAGRLVRLLVGFQNNASNGFLVEGIDGSFRYPQDFSYYIQNFSSFQFNKVVDADHEATFEYMFTPSETFSQRQFGLTINLRYRNADGKQFVNSVYNETVLIVEPDEGLDGETFFLYIFLGAIVVLLGVVGQQFLTSFTKKSRSSTKAKSSAVSTSTSNQVDMEWIPKEHLQTQSNSPRTSPRQRGRQNGGQTLSGNSSE